MAFVVFLLGLGNFFFLISQSYTPYSNYIYILVHVPSPCVGSGSSEALTPFPHIAARTKGKAVARDTEREEQAAGRFQNHHGGLMRRYDDQGETKQRGNGKGRPSGIIIIPLSFHSGNILGLLLLPCRACVQQQQHRDGGYD
jgi:hypothetical protein